MRKFDNKSRGKWNEACGECNKFPDWLIEIEEDDDCEVYICKDCLKKALEMLEN